MSTSFGITEHWHISLVQDGKALFTKDISLLVFNTVSGVLDLQQRIPAFFIQPERLENDDIKEECTVERIACSKKINKNNKVDEDSSSVSIKTPGSAVTVEARLGIGPEASVYLYLVSLLSSLERRGLYLIRQSECQLKSGEIKDVDGLIKAVSSSTEYSAFPDFGRGRDVHPTAGFIDHLKDISNESFRDVIRQEDAQILVEDAFERYYQFLNMEVGLSQNLLGEKRDVKLLELQALAKERLGADIANAMHARYC